VNQDLSTTTFRDIQRLPPGHTLTISNESTTMRRYWRPESITETRFRDRASYVERFSELLTRAVKDRLSTNRVAISMSGGLDSTSIAAIARDRASTHAFTVVYDSLIPDRERYYSTAAAEHLNIPITHLSGDRFSLFDEQVHGDMDQPEPFLLSPLTAQYHGLLRLCASFAPVALSGWDGDALMNEPRRSRLRIRSRFRRLLGKGSQDASLPEWIDESFAERTHLHDRLQAPSRSPVHAHASALRALDSKVWTALFEGYDPSATRLNLEVRHPLIDVRVVEYLLSIPPEPWCSNKHILRCAMKDRLPQVVLNRRKTALAGDPALQLTRGGGVRWLDSFEVNPQLKGFVNLDHRRPVADELTPDAIWASLRVFALNHWLSHSQPPDRLTKERPRAYKISIA
jgi:asparagine synthase (glutamine-hydrolysing)